MRQETCIRNEMSQRGGSGASLTIIEVAGERIPEPPADADDVSSSRPARSK
jgi:hypothetical protein